MSWDFVNTYQPDEVDVELPSNFVRDLCVGTAHVSWDSNVTWNYGPMLCKIAEMSDIEGLDPDNHIKNINNCTNVQAAEVILKFWTIALQNRSLLEDLEPDNGWGDYDSLCQLLQDMHIRNTHCFSKNFVWYIY